MKIRILFFVMCAFTWTSGLFAQTDVQEDIAMIKKNLMDSKEKIRQYEWIETTTTFINGEQKSVKQNQCYYSVDGKLTKVATGATTQAKAPGGIRGKVVANKKEEMADYVTAAVAKIQTYLPPDAGKIQKIYAAGKTTIQVLEPNKKFKLSFPDYNEPGDLLAVSLNKADQKLMALDITTTVDDPKQKVVFNITYGNLPDGTQFPGKTTLDAREKNLKIVIEDSGFKNATTK
jgi:hypothetical protein